VSVRLLTGDCRDVLKTLPSESVHCVVTSPPYYGLRDYGVAGQIGLETSPAEYVAALVEVFREVRRVLRSDGTCWVVIGDSYASGGRSTFRSSASKNKGQQVQDDMLRPVDPEGIKPKDLLGIPWRVAFALQDDGWYLRQDIIWSKPNPMPESVTDRCTKAHEYVFLLSKSPRYYYDAEAISEASAYPGDERHLRTDKTIEFAMPDGGSRARTANPTGLTRNRRSVWTVASQPYAQAHFATFPPALVEPCILAGCPKGGIVLDPFAGAGTTCLVADRLGRSAIGIELNPDYGGMAHRRVVDDAGLFAQVAAE